MSGECLVAMVVTGRHSGGKPRHCEQCAASGECPVSASPRRCRAAATPQRSRRVLDRRRRPGRRRSRRAFPGRHRPNQGAVSGGAGRRDEAADQNQSRRCHHGRCEFTNGSGTVTARNERSSRSTTLRSGRERRRPRASIAASRTVRAFTPMSSSKGSFSKRRGPRGIRVYRCQACSALATWWELISGRCNWSRARQVEAGTPRIGAGGRKWRPCRGGGCLRPTGLS